MMLGTKKEKKANRRMTSKVGGCYFRFILVSGLSSCLLGNTLFRNN